MRGDEHRQAAPRSAVLVRGQGAPGNRDGIHPGLVWECNIMGIGLNVTCIHDIYIYTYVYMYVYIYICMHIYVYINIYCDA